MDTKQVTYEVRDGTIYRIAEYMNGGRLEEALGDRVETIRIDNETVEDMTYAFDLDVEEYIETGRVQRNEPLPPRHPSEIDILGAQMVDKDLQILDLKQQNAALGSSLIQLELRLLALEGSA